MRQQLPCCAFHKRLKMEIQDASIRSKSAVTDQSLERKCLFQYLIVAPIHQDGSYRLSYHIHAAAEHIRYAVHP